MKTLYIFRHGETDWNLQGRMQGSIDIPLNATGRAQALSLEKFFASHPVEAFLTSDLSRALETAKIAAGKLHLPLVQEPLLRETNLGAVEGLTKEDVMAQYGEQCWESWASNDPALKGFRFAGGESKAEHLARLLTGLERFLRTTSYAKIAVSTHGGAMRRLLLHFCPDVRARFRVENCSVYEVQHEQSKHGESVWKMDCALKSLL